MCCIAPFTFVFKEYELETVYKTYFPHIEVPFVSFRDVSSFIQFILAEAYVDFRFNRNLNRTEFFMIKTIFSIYEKLLANKLRRIHEILFNSIKY